MAPVSSDTPVEAVATNGLLTREALLAATVRDEEEVNVPGLGRILVGEISGEERAKIIEKQASDYQQQRVDVRAYQKALLVVGVLDGTSAKEARTPLLRPADADAVMKLGAGKVAAIVTAIERLSGMGAGAVERAEGNSGPTPNASSTSG